MNLGDAHIYESHRDQVHEYLDGVWSADLMNVNYSLLGTIWDFELRINGYKPDNIIKFDLKV